MTNRTTEPGIASLLALDCGGRACSAALWRSGVVVAREIVATDHGQAVLLLPMVERIMAEAGAAYTSLDRIAVAVGPGSFTGLRVALAAAIGLGLAVARPVIGISSFQAAAVKFDPARRNGRRLFVVLDSRREEFFMAELDADLRMVGNATIAGAAEIRNLLLQAGSLVVTGDAPILTPDDWSSNVEIFHAASDAVSVAILAADPAGRFDLEPKPVYVRAPDVTLAKAP